MTALARLVLARTPAFAGALAVCVALSGSAAAGMEDMESMSDDPPAAAQEQPPAERGSERQPARGADRFREAVRESMERQLGRSRERIKRLERALRLIDEGRPLAEVRAQFPDLGSLTGSGDPSTGAGPGARLQEWMGAFERLDEPLPEGPGPSASAPPKGRGQRGPGEGEPVEDGEALRASRQEFMTEFLSSASPDMLERFREFQRRDPEGARERFGRMFPRVRFLYEMRRTDPELYRLRLQDIRFGREALEAARLVARLENAQSPGDAEKLASAKASLRVALEEQFRVRGEILQVQVRAMREKLDEVLSEIGRRDESKARIVEQFADKLVERENKGLKGRAGGSRGSNGPKDSAESVAP